MGSFKCREGDGMSRMAVVGEGAGKGIEANLGLTVLNTIATCMYPVRMRHRDPREVIRDIEDLSFYLSTYRNQPRNLKSPCLSSCRFRSCWCCVSLWFPYYVPHASIIVRAVLQGQPKSTTMTSIGNHFNWLVPAFSFPCKAFAKPCPSLQ